MWWPCFGHIELATTHPRPMLPRAMRATPPTCFQCSGNEIRRCRINMQTCFDERKNCAHVFLGNTETYEHQSPTSGSRKNTRGKRMLVLGEEALTTRAPPLVSDPPPTTAREGGRGSLTEGGACPIPGEPGVPEQARMAWRLLCLPPPHHHCLLLQIAGQQVGRYTYTSLLQVQLDIRFTIWGVIHAHTAFNSYQCKKTREVNMKC